MTTRTTATRQTDQLLDDIHNGLGDERELRTALTMLLAADMAGRTDSPGLRAASYDGDGRNTRRTEHYIDEPGGARQLTDAEVKAGVTPSWSVTVDPDPVGDGVTHLEPDAVHDLAVKATGYARDAANSLHALRNTLAAFTQLRDLDPQTLPVRYCRCAKWRDSNQPPVQHRGTVGGRMPEAVEVCSDCYEAIRRLAEPGTGTGRLPVEDEVRHHDRHGRWRLSSAAA